MVWVMGWLVGGVIAELGAIDWVPDFKEKLSFTLYIYNTAYWHRGSSECDHPKWEYRQSKDLQNTNVSGVFGEKGQL